MRWLTVALTGLVSVPATPSLTVTLEIPRNPIAEYHQPYVAIWIERPDQSVAANLAVWYMLRGDRNTGASFLKDLRQWWRRSGRELTLPIDGVTGATRGPGTHTLSFDGESRGLTSLKAGSYRLVVEAAREGGGRDLVRIPFTWPATDAFEARATGVSELGAVALRLVP